MVLLIKSAWKRRVGKTQKPLVLLVQCPLTFKYLIILLFNRTFLHIFQRKLFTSDKTPKPFGLEIFLMSNHIILSKSPFFNRKISKNILAFLQQFCCNRSLFWFKKILYYHRCGSCFTFIVSSTAKVTTCNGTGNKKLIKRGAAKSNLGLIPNTWWSQLSLLGFQFTCPFFAAFLHQRTAINLPMKAKHLGMGGRDWVDVLSENNKAATWSETKTFTEKKGDSPEL